MDVSILQSLKYILGVGLISISFSAAASYDLPINEPYIGVEVLATNQSYLYGYGNIIYPNNVSEYGVFIGCKLIEYLGVEFGYELQPKKNNYAKLLPGDTFTGDQPLIPNTFANMKSSIKMTHPYLGFFAEYKLKYRGKTKFRFQGLLGMSATHINATDAIVSDQTGALNGDLYIINQNTYSTMQYCPMAKVVATIMVTDKFGVMGVANFRNTRQLKPYALQGGLNQLKLYNTWGIGAGLMYYGFN